MQKNYLDELYQYIESEKINLFCDEKSIDITCETREYVSASIKQGKNLLESAMDLKVATSPLLIYYGYVNIITGLACMVSNEILQIKGHGLDIIKETAENTNFITEIEFLINREGAFPIYYEILKKEKLVNDAKWFAGDILGSILELEDSKGISKYSRIIPVICEHDGKHEYYKIRGKYVGLFEELQTDSVFKQNYILACKNAKSEYIIRKKYKADVDLLQCRNSKSFFKLSYYDKGSIEQIDDVFLYYIILYILSYLVRYCPDYWVTFIKDDANKRIVEDIVKSSISILPRLIFELIDIH